MTATANKQIIRITTDGQANEYPYPNKSGLSFEVVTDVKTTLLKIAQGAIGEHRKIDSAYVRGGSLFVAGSQILNGKYPVERAIEIKGITAVRDGIFADYCEIGDCKLI